MTSHLTVSFDRRAQSAASDVLALYRDLYAHPELAARPADRAGA